MTPQLPLGYRQYCNRSVGVSAKLSLRRTNELFMYKSRFSRDFHNKIEQFDCQIGLFFTNANPS